MKENEMVFGIRAVIEAIQADKEVDKILVKRDLQGDLSKELFEVLRGREIPAVSYTHLAVYKRQGELIDGKSIDNSSGLPV